MGANIFSDVAISGMTNEAASRGANAAVGVDPDDEMPEGQGLHVHGLGQRHDGGGGVGGGGSAFALPRSPVGATNSERGNRRR